MRAQSDAPRRHEGFYTVMVRSIADGPSAMRLKPQQATTVAQMEHKGPRYWAASSFEAR